MSTITGTQQLSEINQKVVQEGEVLPQVTLKDGSRVQTGTVATMLHNINLYNAGVRGAVEEELILAVPTLFKVGMFDLFSVDEWINGNNAGRKFVGEKAQEFLDNQA
ncbi:hypothetical protein MN869_15825 [Acinetobacter sp. NIPH1876]|uniref:DUF7709 family protein n=1 Tax=unclassified Acinetobacter TaxID=196816 RepID=UPI001FADA7E3|nr:hypothetical protein [Acinetobacter sp. NIPH1876]MCJ0829913.1 hypothetical protein [Acinetobacter sp. NIPH1876]